MAQNDIYSSGSSLITARPWTGRLRASCSIPRALGLYFPPSSPSCLVIYHHKSQIYASKPPGGHAALKHLQRSSQAAAVFTRVKLRFPRKEARELYLDQRALDDSAHVLPPLRHAGVVLVEVWRKGEQVGLEIFCRKGSVRRLPLNTLQSLDWARTHQPPSQLLTPVRW